MKKVICFSFVLLLPMMVNADYIAENERIFRAISTLEEQLKELELKQKIQKIENEIIEETIALNAKKAPPPPVIVSTPPVEKPPTRSVNVFEPSDVKLLYLVGTGSNRSAVVSYKSSNSTLKDNTTFYGWRVSIHDNDVALIRGDRRVTL